MIVPLQRKIGTSVPCRPILLARPLWPKEPKSITISVYGQPPDRTVVQAFLNAGAALGERCMGSALLSGKIEDHIANVLRGFDHFVCRHNIVKLKARGNCRLER